MRVFRDMIPGGERKPQLVVGGLATEILETKWGIMVAWMFLLQNENWPGM